MKESLSGSLQENLLVLLCFDTKNAPLIISNVTVEMFESSVYRDIASRAIEFYRQHKKPPSEHISDEFDDILEGKDKKKASLYKDVLKSIYDLKDKINTEYILNQLSKFIRQQSLKLSIVEAIDHINQGRVDEAEVALEAARKNRFNVFDPGTKLTDLSKIFKPLLEDDNYYFTGIKQLDEIRICPTLKELFIIVALPGYGKSWFLIHTGKHALFQRKKVLHITLEMSEELVCMRYFQSLFALSKSSVKKHTPLFKIDSSGKLSKIDFDILEKIKSLHDPGIEKVLRTKLKGLKDPQLIVKQFPTGSLTINKLVAFLENLESYYNFVPDILIIDYADLMFLDSNNIRVDVGRVYRDLRGLAVDRNMAVVTASQANRSAQGKTLITREHLAEDFSKAMIADNLVTFNQNDVEYHCGIARLYVDKGRNDRRGDIVLISQNYSIGQFCLDSVRLAKGYWETLERTIIPEKPLEVEEQKKLLKKKEAEENAI